MNKEKRSPGGRRVSYSRNRNKNSGIRAFASGGTYLLIPLLGIVLALTLFYFAKDFFLGDETPQYSKPEFTVAEEAGSSLSTDVEVDTNDDTDLSAVAIPSGKAGQDSAEKKTVSAKPSNDTSSASSQGQNISGTERSMEDSSWGVQIAMLKSREDAERLAAQVKKKGFNPDITKPGDFYRVRVRGGSTRVSAEGVEKLLRSEGYDTLVVISDGVTALSPSTTTSPLPSADSSSQSAPVTGYHEDDTWGVQVGMLKNRADAERIAGEIRKKGFNVDITKPGEYYRVRVRAGSSEESARKTEELLAAQGYNTLVVKSVD